jgi:hypothetical protein
MIYSLLHHERAEPDAADRRRGIVFPSQYHISNPARLRLRVAA